MDALVLGEVLPLMVLLDTDVVRMLKIALAPVAELVLLPLMVLLSTVSVPSPLAMPPPPSLFFPDAVLPAMVVWLIDTVPKKLTMPPPAWLALLPDTVLRLSWTVPPLLAMPPPSPAALTATVLLVSVSVPAFWMPPPRAALPWMIVSWPMVTLAAGETLNTWLAFLPSTVVAAAPTPWTVMVLAVRDSTPSFRGKVPAGTTMVTALPLGWASASCTAARRVHCPAASAQMPSPGDASGASVVLVTWNVSVAAAASGGRMLSARPARSARPRASSGRLARLRDVWAPAGPGFSSGGGEMVRCFLIVYSPLSTFHGLRFPPGRAPSRGSRVELGECLAGGGGGVEEFPDGPGLGGNRVCRRRGEDVFVRAGVGAGHHAPACPVPLLDHGRGDPVDVSDRADRPDVAAGDGGGAAQLVILRTGRVGAGHNGPAGAIPVQDEGLRVGEGGRLGEPDRPDIAGGDGCHSPELVHRADVGTGDHAPPAPVEVHDQGLQAHARHLGLPYRPHVAGGDRRHTRKKPGLLRVRDAGPPFAVPVHYHRRAGKADYPDRPDIAGGHRRDSRQPVAPRHRVRGGNNAPGGAVPVLRECPGGQCLSHRPDIIGRDAGHPVELAPGRAGDHSPGLGGRHPRREQHERAHRRSGRAP